MLRYSSWVLFFIGSISCQFVDEAAGQLAESSWPDYGGGLSNRHQTTLIGPSSNIRVLWKYETPQSDSTFSQPVLGEGGTIFYTTYATDRSQLVALNPDGSLKWRKLSTGNSLSRWPAVNTQGQIYTEERFSSTGNGTFRARNQSDGEILWTIGLGGGSEAGPTIGNDGTIYSVYRGMGAYSSDGTELWRSFPNASRQYRNPAIAEDGTIFMGGQFDLIALDPNGSVVWSQPTGVQLGPVTIASDGNLFVASANWIESKLLSFTPGGQERWARDDIGGAVSIGLDGTIYSGYEGTLYALDPNTGSNLWTFPAGHLDEFGIEGITVDGDGNLYLANAEGIVMSLTPDGDLRWEFDIAPDVNGVVWPSAPVIGPNGVLYVGGGLTHNFFAIGIPEPTTYTLALAALSLAVGRRR